MKKFMKEFGFAAFLMLSFVGVASAADNGVTAAACELIGKLSPLIKVLRILAFVGAGFTIAGWGYGYLTSGKAELKDVKEKGIGLLVGAFLLFGIGLVLQFLIGAADTDGAWNCGDRAFGVW